MGREFRGKVAGTGLKSDDCARTIDEDEQVAARNFEDAGGFILDGGGVLRGHQGSEVWKIRDQLGGTQHSDFALLGKGLVGFHGIAKLIAKGLADAFFDIVADNQESSGRQARGNGEQREKKLGP